MIDIPRGRVACIALKILSQREFTNGSADEAHTLVHSCYHLKTQQPAR